MNKVREGFYKSKIFVEEKFQFLKIGIELNLRYFYEEPSTTVRKTIEITAKCFKEKNKVKKFNHQSDKEDISVFRILFVFVFVQ